MYRIVERYYKLHIYSAEDVAKFVVAKQISTEDYKKITGLDYPTSDVEE